MSALPPKAEMVQHDRDVRFVPNGDIRTAQKTTRQRTRTRLRSDARLRPKLKTGHRNAAGRHGPTGRNPATTLSFILCAGPKHFWRKQWPILKAPQGSQATQFIRC